MDREQMLRRLARSEPALPEPESPCLSAETLEAFREDRLQGPAREGAERHLARCRACQAHLVGGTVQTPVLPAEKRRELFARLDKEARAETPSFWRQWLRPVVWAPAGAALAAALLLMVNTSRVGETVPPYELNVTGQNALVRGASDPSAAPAIFRPGDSLVLQALPQEGPPARPPRAVAYLRQPDGIYRRIEVEPVTEQDAATGLVQLRFPVQEVLRERYGAHRIRLLLLPAGETPPESLAAEERPHGAVMLEQVFEYQP